MSGSSCSGSLRTVTLRPRGGVPALEAELYDGSGADHARLAGPSPDRRHRAGPARSRSRAGSACRTACGSCSTRATSCAVTATGPTPVGAETVEAVVRAQLVQGARRPARHARGRRTHPRLHDPLRHHQATSQLAVGVSVAIARWCCWWSGWCSARRCSSCSTAWSASASARSSRGARPAAAATPTSRRWPTSCPA